MGKQKNIFFPKTDQENYKRKVISMKEDEQMGTL